MYFTDLCAPGYGGNNVTSVCTICGQGTYNPNPIVLREQCQTCVEPRSTSGEGAITCGKISKQF